MTLRKTLGISLMAAFAAAPVAAQPAPKEQPAASTPEDMSAFEKELDALFAKGGLTSDQAAARAAAASPTVRRRVAEIEVAIAQKETVELARVPQVSGKVSYTRLSHIDPFLFAPGTPGIEFLQNSTVLEANLGVPLSDYVFRFPKLIDAARLGEDAAQVNKRAAEVNAGQDARLAYYEWVRANLQVLIAQRQLAQVQTTLDPGPRARRGAAPVARGPDARRVATRPRPSRRVVQLQNLAELREEQLRLLIGAARPSRSRSARTSGTAVVAPEAGKLDDLLGSAKAHRLEFSAIDTGIRAKEKQQAAELANKLPRLSAFAVGRLREPQPARVPAGGQVHVHVGRRRTVDVDAQRRADRAQDRSSARAPRPTSCAPIARTSSAGPGSRCSRRSRPC